MACTTWPEFFRQHFHEWKCLYFHSCFTEFTDVIGNKSALVQSRNHYPKQWGPSSRTHLSKFVELFHLRTVHNIALSIDKQLYLSHMILSFVAIVRLGFLSQINTLDDSAVCQFRNCSTILCNCILSNPLHIRHQHLSNALIKTWFYDPFCQNHIELFVIKFRSSLFWFR